LRAVHTGRLHAEAGHVARERVAGVGGEGEARGRSRRGSGVVELFARVHADVPWLAGGLTGGRSFDSENVGVVVIAWFGNGCYW
jgi:hypothetical protein